MKRLMWMVAIAMLAAFSASATDVKDLFPQEKKWENEVELGVAAVQRICPTRIWDSWVSESLKYEPKKKVVDWVIRLKSPINRDKINSKENQKKTVDWVVENVMMGFAAVSTYMGGGIFTDGDYMFYLGMAPVLSAMEKYGVQLRITFIQPDGKAVELNKFPVKAALPEGWEDNV